MSHWSCVACALEIQPMCGLGNGSHESSHWHGCYSSGWVTPSRSPCSLGFISSLTQWELASVMAKSRLVTTCCGSLPFELRESTTETCLTTHTSSRVQTLILKGHMLCFLQRLSRGLISGAQSMKMLLSFGGSHFGFPYTATGRILEGVSNCRWRPELRGNAAFWDFL